MNPFEKHGDSSYSVQWAVPWLRELLSTSEYGTCRSYFYLL